MAGLALAQRHAPANELPQGASEAAPGRGDQGWLGALAFSAATWRLKRRDEWIGWSEAARRANLRSVVCNSRFLIVPTVSVPNLACHVLGLCARRIGQDWTERYGYAPVLLETFVDPERFCRSSYAAANWIGIGRTAARSDPYANGKVAESPKEIYVYPLRSDWRPLLCGEPQRALGSRPAPDDPLDWAEEEFGRVELYDERLKRRLLALARDFFAKPGALVPQACNGSAAKTKAAYRFFANRQVDMQRLLNPHIESTIERIRAHRVVLAVQDTSSLNYTAHPAEGLGPINTHNDDAVGLLLHDTIAFTPEGTPLGLLNVQCWARAPEQAGKKHRRKELPIEQKESIEWLTSYRAVAQVQKLCPQTMLVSVGDREADLYDLLHEATQDPCAPKVLVRAERTRNRQVEEAHLRDRMAREPVAGVQELFVPRKGSRPARTAKLEIRFAFVVLSPPKSSSYPPLSVWAVYAREVDYAPDLNSPIDWMLLTTVVTETFEAACERLVWYARRWGIEIYHRTLKGGCRIEDRRLDTVESLEACLALDLVVAWRVYAMNKQSRETPQVSCDTFLSEDEWKALSAYVTGKTPSETPPSLHSAVRMVASLGGFLGRKSDGQPGTTTLWRGLQRLADITLGYRLGRLHSGRAP